MPSKKLPSARATGLIIAGAAALIIAGVTLVIAVSNRSDSRPVPATATGDVTDIDLSTLDAGSGTDSALGALDQGRVQFVDRDDPSRVEAELVYRRINPIGGGFYELTQPQAWIYMQDGRALFIRADDGRVKMPNRTKSPESGEFVGDVVVLLFPARAGQEARRPRDAMIDAPGLVARSSKIRFDTQLLEFASDDRVTIATPGVRFEGTGVLVRGNQVLDRVEYLRVSRDGVIRYRMDAPEAGGGWRVASAGDLVPTGTPEPWQAGWEVADAPDDGAIAVSIGATPVVVAVPTEPAGDEGDAFAETSNEQAAGNPVDPPVLPIAGPTAGSAIARNAEPVPALRTPVAPTIAAKEDLYEAVFANAVRVTQRQRTLSADTLLVWLRTLDNKLAERAFGSMGAPASSRMPAVDVAPTRFAGAVSMSALAAIPVAVLGTTTAAWPPDLFADSEDDLILTWEGPLSLKPLAGAVPRQLLGGNDLALRFSSAAEGGEAFVKLSDGEIGARGGCEELEYLATLRDMTLRSGPGSARVWLAAPEAGCLAGDLLRVNLGTGVADMPGPGLLATLVPDLNQTAMLEGADTGGLPAWLASEQSEFFSRRIDWQHKADFQFRTSRGEIRDALEWAEFRGRTFATDYRSSLAGELMRVDFVETGEQSTLLSKLLVEGNAVALAEAWRQPEGIEVDVSGGGLGNGVLRAASLEVKFEPSVAPGGDVEPHYMLAQGGALVGKDDARMSAPSIEASLQREDRGEIVVTDFEARGSGEAFARFDRGDGVWASGQRIKGHAQRQTASVTGPRVQVARGASVIDSTIVELNGLAGTMDVYAPGTFTHEQPTNAASGPGSGTVRVTANWTDSMTFDDPSGVLECRGQTQVIREEPLTTDTVRAERIRLDLSPAHADTEIADATADATTSSGNAPDIGAPSADERRVERATAFGSILERPDGKPATVESRGYSPSASGGGARTLETISYIESAQLVADDVKATVETPLPGRAVIFDQRAPDATSESDQQGAPAGPIAASPRGTSSFRWEGSMVFARDTGVLELLRKIEVIHKPLDERPLTRMTSERLVATLKLAGESGKARFVAAEATGSVYVESGPQRLMGERVLYDAQNGTAIASAAEGGAGVGTVTLFDDRRATPFTARRLRWDLAKDQIEILEPAPIIAPR